MTGARRITIFILTIILLICSCPAEAMAQADKPEKTVRIGYFAMENFMEGGTDGAMQSGFTYELLCEIATYNHWKMEFVYGEFGELYRELAEGRIDILPNVINTAEREEQVRFHDLELNEEHYYISALESKVNEDEWDISCLNGKRLATVKDAYEGVIFDGWAEERGVSMEKIFCDGFDEAWELLDSGEADYILNINNTVQGSEYVSLCEVGHSGVYFAVAKEREDILADIDYAWEMIDSVTPFLFSNLQQKYLNEALSSYQLSEDEKAWISSHDILRIGGLQDDVPYAYEDSKGDVVGTYVELTELILEKLSIDTIRVEWSLYPSMADLRQALKNGKLDIIFPEYHSHYEAVQNDLAISEIVTNAPMGLLTLSDTNINDIDSVAAGGNRLGPIYVKENFPETNLVTMDSVDEMVKAVSDGKIPGAIAHMYALQESIRDEEARYKISPLSIPCYVCYASTSANNELVMIMNRGYHLISQAELNSLEVRNYGEKVSRLKTARDFFRENVVEIVIAIMFIIIMVIIAVNRFMYAKRLQKSLDEITEKNAVIEAAHRELTIANEAAQKADKAKTSFLFNMSHDIRTPMNAIIGFTRLADMHAENPAEVREYLGKITQASNHLLSLINDVLDMSRIESGKIDLAEKPENIRKVLDELDSIVQADVNMKGLSFTQSVQIEHDYISCDKLRLDRILLNILSNSIKYTPEGGSITAAVKEMASEKPGYGKYEFVIEDNGMGMSEEYLKSIYEPFTRAQSTTVSKIQGSGLGMAITKRLIDMMGGAIVIESKEGVGTKSIVTFEFEIAENPNRTEEADIEYDFSGRKILLAEDNEMNREIATEILEDAGFVVDTAEDGTIAVEKIKNSQAGDYELVLMDVQMPIMNGYEATERIRALDNPELARIRIIAMTANAFEEDKAAAMNAGMDDHIAKPIDVAVLKRVLRRHL